MKHPPPMSPNASVPKPVSRQQSLFAGFRPSLSRRDTISTPNLTGDTPDITLTESPRAESTFDLAENRPSLRRTMSSGLARAGTILRKNSSASPSAVSFHIAGDKEQPREESESKLSDPASAAGQSISSSDVGGPRFGTSAPEPTEERTAGEPSVYQDIKVVISCFLSQLDFNCF